MTTPDRDETKTETDRTPAAPLRMRPCVWLPGATPDGRDCLIQIYSGQLLLFTVHGNTEAECQDNASELIDAMMKARLA